MEILIVWIALLMLGILIFVLPNVLPPQWKTISARKRTAITRALKEFESIYPNAVPDRSSVRVYQSDSRRCVVWISHVVDYIPPPDTFFAVFDDVSIDCLHLGTGQCHWGIQPEDVWDEYGNTPEPSADRAG